MRPMVAVPILMYHEIASRSETESHLAVPPDAFAAQLACLQEDGFQTITVEELLKITADDEHAFPDRRIVLTFDDGFADFHSRATPMLMQYGFRATVFVTTGWVEDEGPPPVGRRPGRMMSWTQVQEVVAAGMEVGAHSHLHYQLDQLPERLLYEELYSSKSKLENILGSAVHGLAYPFGYSNARVRVMAEAAGYMYGCAVGNLLMSPVPDRFALPRLTIRRSTDIGVFRQLVRGKGLSRIFLKDRAMTKAFAIVRRTKAMVGAATRND
jgi:peptidoglycan/xylan/chitin deacetylase (PgdA/CDA1 family)